MPCSFAYWFSVFIITIYTIGYYMSNEVCKIQGENMRKKRADEN
jgi:hypothetical protein